MRRLNAQNNIYFTLVDMKISDVRMEFQFHPVRKFRFDFAIPSLKIAIEYEGIYNSGKMTRHTSQAGYSKDCEKYNLATIMGWRILRYTSSNRTNLRSDLLQLLKP